MDDFIMDDIPGVAPGNRFTFTASNEATFDLLEL